MSQTFLSQLNWRFATKAFDPEKKVSEENLHKILDAIRLAPTSYGLQPFNVEVISNPELRKALLPASYGQAQVTDASYLLVFSARNDIDERIDAYVELASGGDTVAKEKLEPLKQMMKGALTSGTDAERTAWAARQAYLALGFGLAAAAELGIDSCPMEGFDAPEIDKLLQLPPYMHSVAYVTIGYRKDNPTKEKVRFSQEDLFTVR
jgi:nitroreductase